MKRKGERRDLDSSSSKKKRVPFDVPKHGIEESSDDDGVSSAENLSSKGEVNAVNGGSAQANESHFSNTRFDQCPISSLSLEGIKAAGYEKMTIVQEATLPVILKGKDVLAKARTGTGKTASFLLPAIEVVSKLPLLACDRKGSPIFVLVVLPTRELATQVATVANTLTKYHSSISVQVITGGTKISAEQKRLRTKPCQILIATPGRLTDHIKNTAGFSAQLKHLKVLILDEADRLLDMGFRKDIEKIIAAVPTERQTLLFSATVSNEVRHICKIAMKNDHEYINTVEEGTEETHAQVSQMHLVAPLGDHFPILYSILSEHISDDSDYKVIIFCTTAMGTRLVASLLSQLRMNVREIHSRMNQNKRNRVSEEFRKSKSLILVSSDVSARGVDYPDISLVAQLGVAASREQYIHRLGRTGRKGKEGKGILILAPQEKYFLSKIKDLPLAEASIPTVDPNVKKKVKQALSNVDMQTKESAYQAWLGYYNGDKFVGKDKNNLVNLANEYSRSMGLEIPPAIPRKILSKMHLGLNIPGLRSK
ncbi:uncharacterized protein A4U43_C01F3360 [Asparagus officinalis]|uniref:ATP-dependent RNA helicase n=1 Tax=Asparagus officinalis TaxID=4686 RepID=A0A5P1FLY6_ASPOF|nr:DEAD-box ATP-dependent RNA helicase 31-like [Asparagus officinalis]ONK79142.1 uncharacterized protein A4U43_C01F3360 [Asparagus officinalis]